MCLSVPYHFPLNFPLFLVLFLGSIAYTRAYNNLLIKTAVYLFVQFIFRELYFLFFIEIINNKYSSPRLCVFLFGGLTPACMYMEICILCCVWGFAYIFLPLFRCVFFCPDLSDEHPPPTSKIYFINNNYPIYKIFQCVLHSFCGLKGWVAAGRWGRLLLKLIERMKFKLIYCY